MATLCQMSLTYTAIRYARLITEHVAVVFNSPASWDSSIDGTKNGDIGYFACQHRHSNYYFS